MRIENLNGGVKDQDLFALADEDDEDDEEDGVSMDGEEDGQVYRSTTLPPPDVIPKVSSPLPETPPPPPPAVDDTEEAPAINVTPTHLTSSEDQQSVESNAPVVYRLRRGDTLMGIALRFRLDVRFFHGSRPFSQFNLTDRTIRPWNCVG